MKYTSKLYLETSQTTLSNSFDSKCTKTLPHLQSVKDLLISNVYSIFLCSKQQHNGSDDHSITAMVYQRELADIQSVTSL